MSDATTTTHDTDAAHLVQLYNQKWATIRANAERPTTGPDRLTGAHAQAALDAGDRQDAACEEFRRRYYHGASRGGGRVGCGVQPVGDWPGPARVRPEGGDPMSAGTYAAQTTVAADRSRNEIERTLTRYGASSFAYGWQGGQAMIGFVMGGRQIRFLLPLPDPADREFHRTPTGRTRTAKQAAEAHDQATRQRWRALALIVKAKLEAVESGIVTFEDEFAMHMILPDGRRVAEHVMPAIDSAYATGQVPAMLQIGAGR